MQEEIQMRKMSGASQSLVPSNSIICKSTWKCHRLNAVYQLSAAVSQWLYKLPACQDHRKLVEWEQEGLCQAFSRPQFITCAFHSVQKQIRFTKLAALVSAIRRFAPLMYILAKHLQPQPVRKSIIILKLRELMSTALSRVGGLAPVQGNNHSIR